MVNALAARFGKQLAAVLLELFDELELEPPPWLAARRAPEPKFQGREQAQEHSEAHDPAQQQEYSPKNNRSATMEALALTETTDKTAAQSASNEAPDALAAHKQKQLPRGGLGT